MSIFTTIAGRVNVDGSVFGKPVNGLTISGIVVSVTTVVSTTEFSVELVDPPQAANANIDADDHENGGVNAKFAEKGRDVQFGDIYDRKLLERHNFNAFLLL